MSCAAAADGLTEGDGEGMRLIWWDYRVDALDSRYSILLPVLSLASRIVMPPVLMLAVERVNLRTMSKAEV